MDSTAQTREAMMNISCLELQVESTSWIKWIQTILDIIQQSQ